MCLFYNVIFICKIIMFRRNKRVDKAKLEHKLYLARENPEPVFDLTDCCLREVPTGIYSLCRVFLKESLQLQNNCLTSLTGGGQLKDLYLLKVLNISYNSFSSIPEEIYLLKNLQEFYVNNNEIKKLPENMCKLSNLRIFEVSNNILKLLPETMGNLVSLTYLNICGNKHLTSLPKSLSNCQRIQMLDLDSKGFIYPPSIVVENGTEAILRFLCDDAGIPYSPPEFDESVAEEKTDSQEPNDNFEQRKAQEFLEIEKHNETLQSQQIELANASKANREKLLAALAAERTHFDSELNKIQQQKEIERFKLIEQLQEAENNADIVINQLLTLNNKPVEELLNQEKQDEERLLAAVNRYNEALRKDDILAAMQDILGQEAKKFKEFHENRIETSVTLLEQEAETDSRLLEVLKNQDEHKAELVNKLKEDNDLQKVAVGTLLERGDARSWSLVQEVKLVEAQLAALTHIEMDRKKLEIDQQMCDLAEKRINLSILLIDLLEQQKERRRQLLSTLQSMEDSTDSTDDFWLKQYQLLLDKLPKDLSLAQRNVDPNLAQALLAKGVIHCLPFLAKLTQYQYDNVKITDSDLLEAGVTNRIDRMNILDAFQMYEKEKLLFCDNYTPSAPTAYEEEASAPLPDNFRTISTSECVVCFDIECTIIFVPCGHLCCCCHCSTLVSECPLCRTNIERKITVS
ncbi:E3 ubiquitin-protein ligase LRSAM1-like isoform X2 [Anoplophora glabripennis]|uniref:E3 ubiquitin-protein ligase LRSAM1-like isoform X2 n=1 Tax=Anoplophora glabripennis TaxID=217634 RepID=UPI0008736DE9|nr:E3 ubiquitin-protein ligase LRSAM1-like isoform X2 [Anoplophora glabripennis]